MIIIIRWIKDIVIFLINLRDGMVVLNLTVNKIPFFNYKFVHSPVQNPLPIRNFVS